MMKDILRGVGIGCILAGGILYFTDSADTNTDSQSYKTQLDELQTELDKVKEELAIAQTATSTSRETEAKEKTDPDVNEKDGKSEKEQQTSEPITKIILSIESGSNSTSVAEKLEKAGIIENAKDLEAYLMENGLAGRIQIGEHEVDTTMDIQKIARIITNTK